MLTLIFQENTEQFYKRTKPLEKFLVYGLLPHVTYNISVSAVYSNADTTKDSYNSKVSNEVQMTLTTSSMEAFLLDNKIWFISTLQYPSLCQYKVNGQFVANSSCNESQKVFPLHGISSSDTCHNATVTVYTGNEMSPWISAPRLVTTPPPPILNDTSIPHIFQSSAADFCEYRLKVDNSETIHRITGPSCRTPSDIDEHENCCSEMIETSLPLNISACTKYSLSIRCGNFINITEVRYTI